MTDRPKMPGLDELKGMLGTTEHVERHVTGGLPRIDAVEPPPCARCAHYRKRAHIAETLLVVSFVATLQVLFLLWLVW